MTTFRLPAIALTGFLFSLTTTAVSAATITYSLVGRASGDYQALSDPGAAPQSFSDLRFELDLTGDLPGSALPGSDFVHLDSAVLTVGGHTVDLDIGPHWLFSIDPASGVAAIGRMTPTGFDPTVRFSGSGLEGYGGVSTLDPAHVQANFKDPFRVSGSDDTVRVEIDDFDRARFAAVVPEPAGWALMLAGFGGAGALLRRRRAAVSLA